MREIFDDIKNAIFKDDRVEAIGQLAEEHGFLFYKRQKFHEQPYQIRDFKLFKGKKGKRITGILTKTSPLSHVNARIYDYIYFADSKKKRTTVFEFYFEQISLGPFLIRPKRNVRWVKEIFSKRNRPFRDQLGFHSFYEVVAHSRERVENELSTEFIQLVGSKSRIWVEGNGHYLIVYYRHQQAPIGEILNWYESILDMVETILPETYREEDMV